MNESELFDLPCARSNLKSIHVERLIKAYEAAGYKKTLERCTPIMDAINIPGKGIVYIVNPADGEWKDYLITALQAFGEITGTDTFQWLIQNGKE